MKKKVTYEIDEEVVKMLNMIAASNDLTLRSIVEKILKEYCDNHQIQIQDFLEKFKQKK